MDSSHLTHIGSSWDDLRAYGIAPLTGEACTIGLRILCDLNERGARIVRTLIGLPADAKLAENWNSASKIGTHVASAKLPYDLFDALAVVCLFDAGCKHVIVTRDHGIYGVATARLDGPDGVWAFVDQLRGIYGRDAIARTYSPVAGQPAVGLDAVPASSGRSL
jgi:hypothetical protein